MRRNSCIYQAESFVFSLIFRTLFENDESGLSLAFVNTKRRPDTQGSAEIKARAAGARWTTCALPYQVDLSLTHA